jgi:hypothetical protein
MEGLGVIPTLPPDSVGGGAPGFKIVPAQNEYGVKIVNYVNLTLVGPRA